MGRGDVILDLFATVFTISYLIYLIFCFTTDANIPFNFAKVSFFTHFLYYSRSKFISFLVYLTSGKHFSGMQMSPSRVERFAPSNLLVIYSRIRLDVLRKQNLIVKLYVERRGCDKLWYDNVQMRYGAWRTCPDSTVTWREGTLQTWSRLNPDTRTWHWYSFANITTYLYIYLLSSSIATLANVNLVFDKHTKRLTGAISDVITEF